MHTQRKGLQPPPPTVAAPATYGCSPRHLRLQASSSWAACSSCSSPSPRPSASSELAARSRRGRGEVAARSRRRGCSEVGPYYAGHPYYAPRGGTPRGGPHVLLRTHGRCHTLSDRRTERHWQSYAPGLASRSRGAWPRSAVCQKSFYYVRWSRFSHI